MADRFIYRITTQSRVSAAATGEMLHHTPMHEVLPGATVRGALAALWWLGAADRGESQGEFVELFDTQLAVSQALPIEDGPDREHDTRLNSASTFFCKYPQPDKDCREFQLDLAAVVAGGGDPVAVSCSFCAGTTKTDPGWKRGYAVTRTTRTQLEPNGTAADGNLFRRESMPKGLLLEGLLWAPDGVQAWVDGAHIRLGGKRSVMGAATIQLERDSRVDSPELGDRAALRLCSPAIIVDRWGAASLAESDWLAELERVSGDELSRMCAWTRSERVTGWHMRSALPKPADWALAAGSTIVVEGLTPEGWLRLSRGIGLRTLEGYGHLEILTAQQAMQGRSEPERDPIEVTFDALVAAMGKTPVSGVLRSVHGVLGEIRKDRNRSFPRPEVIIAKHKRTEWFRSLSAEAKDAVGGLFVSDLLDQGDFLTRFDSMIHRLAKQERQK